MIIYINNSIFIELKPSMKKLYLIIGLYMCICHRMVAQYIDVPVINIPIPASITPQISIGTPVMSSVSVNPWKSMPGIPPSSYRVRTYDVIHEDDREIEGEIQRQYYIKSLAGQGFSSRSKIPGTEYFYQAYEQLYGMLTDSVPIDLGKAVFLVENALLGNTLDYEAYQKQIDERADLCRWKMMEEKLSAKDNLAKNKILFQLFTEKMTVKQPGTEKKITHYPVQYNLDDYQSKKDFTSHFVTTLLRTNKGQCYSMPLLYLIIAEKLGAEAYLSYSPFHSFVKIKDNKGCWYNLELTCCSILSDEHYMNNSLIKSDAVRSGLYLSAMGRKEVVAAMMIQLGHYYYIKFDHDPFVLKCVYQAEKQIKTPVDAWRLEAHYENKLIQTVIPLLRIRNRDEIEKYHPVVYQHCVRLNDLKRKIQESGYEKLPPQVYQKWLDHVEVLKKKEAEHLQSPINKIIK